MERVRVNALESAVVISPTETSIQSTGGKSSSARLTINPASGKLSAATADGENMVIVDQLSARVVRHNRSGEAHGLVVEADSTTLSGGSQQSTTTMRVDDEGVTFERVPVNTGRAGTSAASGAPVPVHGVAAGKAATDAVNVGQLEDMEDEAYRGIAISNAMDVFLPDPGKKFRLNMGVGYYKDQTALGLTGSGRITENIGLYIGAASDSAFKEVGGKAGVSFQW